MGGGLSGHFANFVTQMLLSNLVMKLVRVPPSLTPSAHFLKLETHHSHMHICKYVYIGIHTDM